MKNGKEGLIKCVVLGEVILGDSLIIIKCSRGLFFLQTAK